MLEEAEGGEVARGTQSLSNLVLSVAMVVAVVAMVVAVVVVAVVVVAVVVVAVVVVAVVVALVVAVVANVVQEGAIQPHNWMFGKGGWGGLGRLLLLHVVVVWLLLLLHGVVVKARVCSVARGWSCCCSIMLKLLFLLFNFVGVVVP